MKFIIVVVIAFLVASCKKESKCEKWRTAEECVPKRSGVICGSYDPSHYIDETICGDDLNGMYPGASKVIYEDSIQKETRTYIDRQY
jgi:hypothetical protein